MTSKFSVVGSPISHSLSPKLHGAAYAHLGLSFGYELHEVKAGGLESFLLASDFSGLSVTMPLKEEAFALASLHDRYSELTGVSNTLVRDGLNWKSSNTDVFGITQSLNAIAQPNRAVLIGSGATTRSALVALAELYPSIGVTIVARNASQRQLAVEFASDLGLDASGAELGIEPFLGADLVMSLVPAGGLDDFWNELADAGKSVSGYLFDVSYHPWPSTAANIWGSERTISGLEMLVWQAIDQVRLFSGGTLNWDLVDANELYAVMKAAVSSN